MNLKGETSCSGDDLQKIGGVERTKLCYFFYFFILTCEERFRIHHGFGSKTYTYISEDGIQASVESQSDIADGLLKLRNVLVRSDSEPFAAPFHLVPQMI